MTTRAALVMSTLAAAAAQDAATNVTVATTVAPMINMQMWFYQGTTSIVLFQSWSTQSLGSYIVALVLCFAVSCLMMLVKTFMGVIAHRAVALQALVAFVFFNLSYAVMLIAMAFNGGLYLACTSGMTAGFVLTKMYERGSKSEGLCDVETCH
eukprot:TRINITY_DN1779_c2_g1_i1.p3 TRINITY_DN1779_c2_g1~~TRINITY_DN1779_c2_g1_i1.p3  ORF type:complete len:153 (+),score=51.38 TRINITY_DN1779_c2_g1_i1:67-525(+)